MSTLEIVGGVAILILSLITIILCLSQEQKSQDSMTSALSGGSADSFYGKNEGRTKEAILAKITRFLSILLFIVVIAVNFVPIFTK